MHSAISKQTLRLALILAIVAGQGLLLMHQSTHALTDASCIICLQAQADRVEPVQTIPEPFFTLLFDSLVFIPLFTHAAEPRAIFQPRAPPASHFV
ncbi:MAG: hypothetical protein KZQ58_01625 [gamma proteobacterium symbiont of Bathyaustriella thionipta]|nr:hypothetical protein [gamma proteobacterium symbiont of Bathyaustriella thionipta]